MIEAIKVLAIVGSLSLCAFIYARMAFSDIVGPAVIDRWRNIYLVTTAACCLMPNFWIMLFALAFIAIAMGAQEKFKPALYLLLLFAVPAANAIVPGFAGIRNFLALYPFNILAIVILFPLLLRPAENRRFSRIGGMADFCFIIFSIISLAIAFRDTTFTDGLRRATTWIMVAFGPYLVFSRTNWTLERLKLATLAYVIPLVGLSAIAVFEVVLHWHFYKTIADYWNIGFFALYLERGGFLRAYASVFGPISFGLFGVVAIALLPALIASSQRKFLPRLGFLPLIAGLVATFSRGPWIGAVLAALTVTATGDKPMRNLIRFGFLGVAGFFALAVTPMGSDLINMLPFIGDISDTTVSYRQRLFEVGWPMALRNPWFGSEDYLQTPEMRSLMQGQGIIDIVNAYLQVALDKGLVGLALFVGASGFSLLALHRAIRPARSLDPELGAYCQSWFAALVAVMLVLATTTNVVAQIAEVHWLLCGLCVGVARSVAAATAAAETAPAPVPEPAPESPTIDPEPALARNDLPPHLRQYANR